MSIQVIGQDQVDLVAEELLGRGVRPTILKVQAVIGGERHHLRALLENWARRLHCRITGQSPEIPEDPASAERQDLQLLRDADAIQRKASRALRRAPTQTSVRDKRVMRKGELEREIERMAQKIRSSESRQQELQTALVATEQAILAAQSRTESLKRAMGELGA